MRSAMLAVSHNGAHWISHGTAVLLSVETVIVFEIGGGEAEVQQDTDLIRSEVGSVISESSCCSRFLTVSTAAEIGIQVKSEVTSKDTMVSLGDSFSCWIFFTKSVEFCI